MLLGLGSVAILSLLAGRAAAQAEVRNPTQPVLVLDTDGHNGPVMALVFTPDGGQLLSAGMDKVVHVWNLAEEDRGLARTIRPPIWRGLRGAIFDIALSPKADREGQRLLAVAGFGVQSTSGNIALYRYPGADPGSTGEIVAQLPAGTANDPEPEGHWNAVKCLAFDPTGQFLASGSFDGTIRIWDTAARRTLAVFQGHDGTPVTNVAFTPDGKTLASTGANGHVVLWNVEPRRLRDHDRQRTQAEGIERRKQLADDFNRLSQRFRARPNPQDARPDDPAGVAINALAISPDGKWLMIGRENGRLIRYQLDATGKLGDERWLAKLDRQGAVEALTFSPDSSKIAVSFLSQKINSKAERPPLGCDVEVRGLNGEALAPRIALDHLVYALAFRPDGQALAYAGGNAQAVYLKDLRDPQKPTLALVGQGRTVWDVGFSPDGQTVGFALDQETAENPRARYWGFHPRDRSVTGIARADLRRALHSFGGSVIEPVLRNRLRVVDGRGQAREINLERTDGSWWSYSFIPPSPEHPRLAVAVGADAGVVIFAREADGGDFRRVRLFAGHSGSVYALAPSADGKWLVTGSADQTVRLWTLAGCDQRGTFGATFAPGEDGRPTVQTIAPRSYAEAMGLEKGDVIKGLFIGGEAREPAEHLDELDGIAPEVRLEFQVQRGNQAVELGITKRDSPALTLFLGLDREWVLWMPQGYYDTSIAGDRKFLGWHRNGIAAGGAGVDIEAPTDFFTIDRFEPELRRPVVLNTLLATADLGQALALVPPPVRDAPEVVRQDSPPRVRITTPARPAVGRLIVGQPNLAVLARGVTDDLGAARRAIGAIRFLVDSQVQQTVNPAQPEAAVPAQLTLAPGVHKVNVVISNDRGRERTESFEVEYRPPPNAPPPAREPRLVVLAFGAGTFPKNARIPAIRFAEEDVRDVARFLAARENHGFANVEPPVILQGPDASAPRIRDALQTLDSERTRGDLGPGDTVVVLVESHVLMEDGETMILGTDADAALPPRSAFPAVEVANALGELATYGCRVLVLLDGVHEAPNAPPSWKSRVDGWTRELYRRNVITFVASVQGASQRVLSEGHGAFAQALLDSRNVRSESRLRTGPEAPRTLDHFRDVVEQEVRRLTGRKQIARCYVPGTIHPQIAIFDPPEGSGAASLKAAAVDER